MIASRDIRHSRKSTSAYAAACSLKSSAQIKRLVDWKRYRVGEDSSPLTWRYIGLGTRGSPRKRSQPMCPCDLGVTAALSRVETKRRCVTRRTLDDRHSSLLCLVLQIRYWFAKTVGVGLLQFILRRKKLTIGLEGVTFVSFHRLTFSHDVK